MEQNNQQKALLEHILKRPEMYTGSTQKTISKFWILEENKAKFTQKEIEYVPALYKIIDEILVNAAEHSLRDESMDTIKVTIDEDKNLISVWNNGEGIPVVVHKEYNLYVPELIFGHLVGSSADKTQGYNGYGARLTNIFSKKFTVETADSNSEKQFKMTWQNNMSTSSSPEIASHSGKDFTCVTFQPDLQRFNMDHLEKHLVHLIRKRVYDIAGIISQNVKIFLNDQEVPVKGFSNYIDLYLPEGAPKLRDTSSERWDITISVSNGQFQQVSFANFFSTYRGGTHVQHCTSQIVEKVLSAIQKRHPNLNIDSSQVEKNLSIFIKCQIVNPAFDSQTKDNLVTPTSKFGKRWKLSEKFLENILKSGIIDQIVRKSSASKEDEEGISEQIPEEEFPTLEKSYITGIPKFIDATYAGTIYAESCTLILTEGDSVQAFAVSGIEALGREKFGVFPLRGKLMNVRDMSPRDLTRSEEIMNIMKIMGLEVGKQYKDVKSLRYGSIMIMTDQDVDGIHIKGLIINFIHHFWPGLVKIPGFISEFRTPIVRVSQGNEVKNFENLKEYRNWQKEVKSKGKQTRVKFYQGMGTSTDKEAKEYFQELRNYRIDFEWKDEADDEAINRAFSKKAAEERKVWLANHQPGSELDKSQKRIRYSDFVDKELIKFSYNDTLRSIPSICDGLKPSQRKVLSACFRRNLVEGEISVTELGAYVIEHYAYHYGECALWSTIVGLAQAFVGANNVNLLEPIGQFGTRNLGGKDSANARYIFTRLNRITRFIFPEPDDHVCNYLEENGKPIEPEWLMPIIPLVLVNGAQGIGTGWSTSIPCFNPSDIIENIKRRLKGEKFSTMVPWYKGWKGEMKFLNDQEWEVKGRFNIIAENFIEITELPIEKWTSDYKAWLEREEILKNVLENHFGNSVNFIVELKRPLDSDDNPEKIFKLSSKISTRNMVLIDHQGTVKNYAKVEEILEGFFAKRLEFYTRRKEYLLSKIQRELEILENQKKFILAVRSNEMDVLGQDRITIARELARRGFSEMRDIFQIKSRKPVEEEKIEMEEEGDDARLCKEFQYLLCLPIESFSPKKVDELTVRIGTLEAERKSLSEKSAEELWEEDLEKLQQVLAEENEKLKLEEQSQVNKKKVKVGSTASRTDQDERKEMEIKISTTQRKGDRVEQTQLNVGKEDTEKKMNELETEFKKFKKGTQRRIDDLVLRNAEIAEELAEEKEEYELQIKSFEKQLLKIKKAQKD